MPSDRRGQEICLAEEAAGLSQADEQRCWLLEPVAAEAWELVVEEQRSVEMELGSCSDRRFHRVNEACLWLREVDECSFRVGLQWE